MSKILASLAVAAFVVCVPAAAHAGPSGTSCPGAFALWDVAAEPYGVDNWVDERGNNDGWACAKPINVVTDEEGNPFQIYNFLDNMFLPRG